MATLKDLMVSGSLAITPGVCGKGPSQCVYLQSMRAVDVPIYDFTQHRRSKETRRVEPADVVLLEGILVLAMDSHREFLNMKIFVDTDDDVRLARR